MSNAASNYLERKILDHVLGEGARNYTSPTLYVALFTAVTGLEGNSPTSEVSTSGTAYARVAVNFAAADTTSDAYTFATTSGDVEFAAATGGGFGTVTHVAIVDHQTNTTWGSDVNVLFFGQLSTSKTISASDIFKITAGNLTVQLA